jgi:uncharacterized membrane protein
MDKKTFINASASASRHFIAGLAVLLPLFLTFLILKFLLERLDSILGPIFTRYIGFSIPGLGLITLILLIWFAGVLTTNYLGKQFVKIYENIISKVPILNSVFSGIKQISDALFSSSKKTFSKTVVVEFPDSGIKVIGFLPSDDIVTYDKTGKKSDVYHVFIPNSPNPMSGFVILVDKKYVQILDTSVADGLKAIIAMGMYHPGSYLVSAPKKKNKK